MTIAVAVAFSGTKSARWRRFEFPADGGVAVVLDVVDEHSFHLHIRDGQYAVADGRDCPERRRYRRRRWSGRDRPSADDVPASRAVSWLRPRHRQFFGIG